MIKIKIYKVTFLETNCTYLVDEATGKSLGAWPKNYASIPTQLNNTKVFEYDLSNYNDRGNWKPLDLTNWLDDVNVYKYNFGEA